ncbi:MAG: hypothetical protein EZS28_031751 [Streblomastix strix]|uniref:Reverse transcriptase domain-containing protein n=1 Tax=Streblomastix strix TaxID=222440 RepID=A0A5J4UQX5_9EUKA|nr:MAG: hypothetical protein EZS28_031751 [Streblomastix strix]
MAHHRHNHPNDNDDDVSVNSDPGLQVQARAQIPFDDFVNAMDVESEEDEDQAASLIQYSSDDDHQSIYSASGDEEIRKSQLVPRLRSHLEADSDASSLSESESEAEAVPGIKRRRLLEDESEDNKEKSESDSISPQDTETKQLLQKLAHVLGKGKKHNKKAATRLVNSRINQKPKDYDALGSELDEHHIIALWERSKVYLTPINIVMPPRIVNGERSPLIGGPAKNLIAAQRTGIIVIESVFNKGKGEAAERVKDMFELVSQAIEKEGPVDHHLQEEEATKEDEDAEEVTTATNESIHYHANVELNKSIQLQTDLKSHQHIYQLRSDSCNNKDTRIQGQNATVHNKLPDQVSPYDVLTSQKCNNQHNSQEQLSNNDQLAKWEDISASQVLIEGAQANCRDVEAPVQLKKSRKFQEFRRTEEEEKIYTETVQEEIQQGIVTRIPKVEVYFLNRTLVIPKKDGRKRKILDCHLVNKYLHDISFKGEDFKKVANITLRGDWATVLEISSFYNHIKVSEELQKYLAFTFAKETYTYIGMPFGLKTAPYIFHKHIHPAIALLRKEELKSINTTDMKG